MIKEIVAQIKTNDLEILAPQDSGYFDDDIIETIESAGCQYLIKGKEVPTLASQVTDPSVSFIRGDARAVKQHSFLRFLRATHERNWTPGTRIEDLSYPAY